MRRNLLAELLTRSRLLRAFRRQPVPISGVAQGVLNDELGLRQFRTVRAKFRPDSCSRAVGNLYARQFDHTD